VDKRLVHGILWKQSSTSAKRGSCPDRSRTDVIERSSCFYDPCELRAFNSRRSYANGCYGAGESAIFIEVIMEGKRQLDKVKKYAERATRAAKGVAAVAFCVAMLGLYGGGYCEHEARFSPTAPDLAHGYTTGAYFKGETRYVSSLDSKICAVSPTLAFSGIGVCILIAGFYYMVLGRMP
jgi:hypothetical protein